MGSNSHLFDRKPVEETIAGQVARSMTPPYLRPKTKKELGEEKQRRCTASRFNTQDEREWLDQGERNGT